MKTILSPGNLVVSFLFLLQSTISYGQAPAIQWQTSLGGSNEDKAQTVRPTNDGGAIVAGYTMSGDGDIVNTYGAKDALVVKLNSNGVKEWAKSFGGSSDDIAVDVQPITGGGYIIACMTYSNDGDIENSHGGSDILIIKLDANGNTLWKHTYGGSDNESTPHIVQSSGGGYLFAANTYSGDSDVPPAHGSGDIWLVKLDADGSLLSSVIFGGSNEDNCHALQKTSDGGYILAGSTYSNDADAIGNTDIAAGNGWVMKVDLNCSIEWQKSLGGTAMDKFTSIQQTADGNYIAAGITFSTDGICSSNHGLSDSWLVKLNNTGQLQWSACYGGSGSEGSITAIKQKSNGNFVMATTISSSDGQVVNDNTFGPDFWLVSIDNTTGNLQWQSLTGGGGVIELTAFEITASGNYLMAGICAGNVGDVTGNHGVEDYWVVQLNSALLPVQLLFFRAAREKEKVHLTWATSSEQNSNKFIVQRSYDKRSYVNIGEIKSAGNSDTFIQYGFDDMPASGQPQIYYRLKQVDIDGRVETSPVIMVSNGSYQYALTVINNPVVNDLVLIYESRQRSTAYISMFDYQGRRMFMQKIDVQPGVNTFNKQLDSFANGIYVVEVRDGSNSIKTTVVK